MSDFHYMPVRGLPTADIQKLKDAVDQMSTDLATILATSEAGRAALQAEENRLRINSDIVKAITERAGVAPAVAT